MVHYRVFVNGDLWGKRVIRKRNGSLCIYDQEMKSIPLFGCCFVLGLPDEMIEHRVIIELARIENGKLFEVRGLHWSEVGEDGVIRFRKEKQELLPAPNGKLVFEFSSLEHGACRIELEVKEQSKDKKGEGK